MSDVKSTAEPVPPTAGSEKKCPPGCVERTLNFRDRNLLIGAARDYCSKKEHADFKNQAKLDRLTKLVSFQETLEYFEMINDHYDDVARAWKSARRKHNAWKDMRAGLYKDSASFSHDFPDVDLEEGVPKPPLRAPEATPKEMRGEERPFYLPSKLDVWVQDLLKSATWQAFAAEFAVELCSKFGLKDEDA